MHTHKIAFVGEPGSGKTTCIGALSDISPLVTDVRCTDELSLKKETTTVAFDYGELSLGDSGKLLLYGLPGQARFRFMFDVVREGLLGVIVLVDASSDDALQGLSETLETYGEELRTLPVVVGINKATGPSTEFKGRCKDAMRIHGVIAPILDVDARRRADVVRMFELLFMLLEYRGGNTTAIQESP
jgi:uncharacterized protein